MIIPARDKSLIPLAKHKEKFEKYTKLPIADYDLIMKARDKSRTLKIAEQIGIPIPKTYYPEIKEDLDQVKDFPIIIKPRLSSGSRGFAYCETRKELQDNFSLIIKDYPDGLLVQEYIPMKDEISC